MVSCYHILHFRCSRILYDVVSPSLSCYKVVFIWLNPILLVLACFCFIIMCYLLCYRTDSALKFGWFFLCYSASFIYIFLAVTIHYVLVLLSAFLFIYSSLSPNSSTFCFAFWLQLHLQSSSKENLSRELPSNLFILFI